ncbi:MAG: TonB-dependent receptor, partial [Fulvivirga sp.]
DGSLNLTMEEEPQILQEVTITSDQSANVSNVRMGAASLNMEELKNVPKILGENDMIQAALTLPGVQNVGEGAAGINVRGGKTDQNLIQLNHATIYNPFHFFGFFSSFNADITASSELIKSGIPATYGGRLSSLLNVKMKKANKDHFSGKIGLNPITTKVSVEIPLIKDRTSLMAGGRTTYSDWVVREIPNENFKNSAPSFSDFAINLNHSYGESNSINLSGYYSTDKFKLSTDSINNYSNINGSLEWSHLINSKLSSTLIAGATNYQFSIDYEAQPESAFDYGFEINEQFGKLILNYFPSDIHDVQVGTDIKLYNLQPGKIRPIGMSDVTPEKLQTEKGIERAFFISDEFKLSQKVSLYGGLRYSFFSPIGNRTVDYYQSGSPKNDATRTATIDYEDGEVIDTYHGPELRFSGKYSLNSQSSVKLGVTQMRQYIHAISSTVSVAPTDTWKLSDPNFAPQKSIQYSIGYYRELMNKKLELSVESYYKDLQNLLDYKIGADLVLNQNLETEVIQGEGRAYGLEFLLKKPTGKLNGWVSYTFSKSQQKFESDFAENRINNGNYFSSNFEKPHDLSIVTNYKYTRRYSFSMNVVYSTGRPITYPTGQYTLSGIEITHFSKRNGYRIPNYFRVDLSVNIEGSHKVNKPGHGYWSISIYNVLARKNVYSVFFSNDNGTIKGYELSVLGTAIPSITYNIKF